MHAEAFAFVYSALEQLPPRRRVVEFGGLNINGSVRSLFRVAQFAQAYTSVDIAGGPGVDVVCDAAEYCPEIPPDTVVCCEVFEHTPRLLDIVRNAFAILTSGGVLITTCAAEPRAPHSAADGGPVRQGEYYGNVSPAVLHQIAETAGFQHIALTTHPHGDLYLVAHKP